MSEPSFYALIVAVREASVTAGVRDYICISAEQTAAELALLTAIDQLRAERDEARALATSTGERHKREMDDKDARWLDRLERVSETIDSDRHQQIAALTRELSEARAQLNAAQEENSRLRNRVSRY